MLGRRRNGGGREECGRWPFQRVTKKTTECGSLIMGAVGEGGGESACPAETKARQRESTGVREGVGMGVVSDQDEGL